MRNRLTIICWMLLLAVFPAKGQIKIGGNVYGGGNKAMVKGNTNVTVYSGDIGANVAEKDRPLSDPKGKVFGGARMAEVGGRSYVNVDGENASGYIVANQVFGGNDIAGHIGTGDELPEEIKDNRDGVDNTWNSFVHLSTKTDSNGEATSDNQKIFIGQVYAGSNGAYYYKADEDGIHNIYKSEKAYKDGEAPIATNATGFIRPEIDKAYLDIQGGTIDYAYGGGNNATVKVKNVIHVDNPSDVVTHIWVGDDDKEVSAGTTGATDLLFDKRLEEMGINNLFSFVESDEYQIGRLFGGNNLAEMAIMPTWDLQRGKIRNLYSGGNKGAMTSPIGLLLEIDPKVPDGLTYEEEQAIKNKLKIENVYGGCRMADVRPTVNGNIVPVTNLTDRDANNKLIYRFPDELAARVLVRGGYITNVYGGNDITGIVYGGNAIGIYTTIQGDVYGGGNGAYPYLSKLENNEKYADLYFGTTVAKLNDYRPNAEQVSIRLKGTDSGHPTIIKGGVYVGGNCATLNNTKTNPRVELKIGSYVIADRVFLGNNGEKMIDPDILEWYAKSDYSTLNLKAKNVFAEYMEGVAMDLKPKIVFDKKGETDDEGDAEDYVENSSYVGSFFLGGNVGSMAIPGKNTYLIDHGLNIFDKFVGGCNNANVKETELNASYEGGVIGCTNIYEDNVLIHPNERDNYTDESGNIKDRIEINLDNLTITPLRWNDERKMYLIWNTNKWGYTYTAIPKNTVLDVGEEYYTYTPYVEHTVPANKSITVGTSDKYYTKTTEDGKDKYNLITAGTTLTAGNTYYTYVANNYTKQTVSGSAYTVTETDNFFTKGDKQDFVEVPNSPIDEDVRLLGGNVYGGCYNSGHVNGNVTININETVLDKDEVFGEGTGIYNRFKSGVDFENQRDDVRAMAMTLFGGGCGADTEIWGSTTVNVNNGYVFQIFGGGEEGIVGKPIGIDDSDNEDGTFDEAQGLYYTNKKKYQFDIRYSSTVNLNGSTPIYTSDDTDVELAESEYIYGGGNMGDVCGNTYVNLGDGRIYDAFGGASDANILGHTEVYIGRQPDADNGGYKSGFPWMRDNIYGGNDFGGTIFGQFEEGYDFTKRVRDWANDKTMIHGYKENEVPEVLKGVSYVEYLQGRVDSIFGGSYGSYDYNNTAFWDEDTHIPTQKSAYVNIRPNNHSHNELNYVFGAGTGYPGYREGDKSQDRSYVLVDIPYSTEKFNTTEFFGAGSYNGLGTRFHGSDDGNGGKIDTFDDSFDPDQLSAIIDLWRGQIGNVYGGSFNEGVTARTVVNVPEGSTITMYSTEDDYDDPPKNRLKHVKQYGNIFGGAYGTQILPPCDVLESNVNYNSALATVKGSIFGGNNNERRTLYSKVNIYSPVYTDQKTHYTATIYGAGQGKDTWSEYTEVNLHPGAEVYEVFGGGMMGHVLNAESVQKYMQLYKNGPSDEISTKDPYWKDSSKWTLTNGERIPNTDELKAKWATDWGDAWTLGGYYTPDVYNAQNTLTGYNYDTYAGNTATNLNNTAIVRNPAELDDKTASQLAGKKYNTNVIIHEGAKVSGYAYGGGYGKSIDALSGDVYGTTYIALLGGDVSKDVYAAGRAGGLNDIFGAGFTPSANAYIKGGMCRNVYGGGYEGHVGYHAGEIYTDFVSDRLAEANVVIGKEGATAFRNGVPAIMRNVYGGGEGGSVYGTSNVTMNNGYVGYRAKNTAEEGATPVYDYVPELDDSKPNDLELSGNIFGGGYVVNSYVDYTNVNMYGGTVRGSLYGGGEVGPIGRGTIKYADADSYKDNGVMNNNARIFKAGKTHVKMLNGLVMRNVFGGGRGKDSWGGNGTKFMDEDLIPTLDLECKGYVFGQTEVEIHGGEIGTVEGMANNYGNVFGGGDEGAVYSAYEKNEQLFIGKKSGKRYNEGLTASNTEEWNYQGYYYKHQAENDITPESMPDGATGIDSRTGFFINSKGERLFTEDCKVVVEPWLQVTAPNGITYDADGDGNAETYAKGDYVPIGYLNTLPKKNADTSKKWDEVDVGSSITENGKTIHTERGVIIHNAVFAGGNIASGSNNLSADVPTVFGNATASINDVYNRDFITIGTGHTGGLYGDGNLTLVDGYRELNITNYGTDYYNIDNESTRQITITEYNELPPREQAYYEVKYKCVNQCTDNEGTTYSVGSTIPEDELLAVFEGTDKISNGKPNSHYWVENGVVSIYAGRIMNTIQRADLCGVWGSRMVMKGAEDRVVDNLDHTKYTINRVREVSLNKKEYSSGSSDFHGNYFGIYSNVNFLGALSSDVKFYEDERKTNVDVAQNPTYAPNSTTPETFAQWKEAHRTDRMRNNGTCHNLLALASGVCLEVTTEESTGQELEKKVWGPITGVIELDLINVQPGIGGGFVYAKNIHGKHHVTGRTATTLTALNEGAATQWDYDYLETNPTSNEVSKEQEPWETSGNFINSSVNQPIIDDCYNFSGRYEMNPDGTDKNGRVPAHYWFIQGQVYVYDQYISAYTGSPNAYSETKEIPLTIAAAANGKLTLMNVKPNLYAYYSVNNASTKTKLADNAKIVVNDKEYYLNDPISYWDWSLLPNAMQKLFIEDTYVTTDACKIGNNIYPAGYVMRPEDYDAMYESAVMRDLNPMDEDNEMVKAVLKVVKDEDGNDVVATDVDGNHVYVAFDDVFHPSNNVSHDTGYLLTYNVNNPSVWDQWYTKKISATREKDQTGGEGYEDAPTYHPIGNGLYGQQEYGVSDIIPMVDATTYLTGYNKLTAEQKAAMPTQAVFEQAYVTTEYVEATNLNGIEEHFQKGAKLAKSEYTTENGEWPAALNNKVTEAYVSTTTIQISETDFIYPGNLMTLSEKTAYIDNVKADMDRIYAGASNMSADQISTSSATAEQKKALSSLVTVRDDLTNKVVEAYYCTSPGYYGGDYYESQNNYRALAAWSSMSEADRDNFTFNYDALDLLIDPYYGVYYDENNVRHEQKEGKKYQYDGKPYDWSIPSDATAEEKERMKAEMLYSLSKPIDYTATYTGNATYTDDNEVTHDGFTYTDESDQQHSVAKGEELSRERYESLPNEQRHYTPINVTAAGDYYVVHEGFMHGETPYAVGSTISADKYGKLSQDEKDCVTTLTFTADDMKDSNGNPVATITYYYCREAYTVNEKGMGCEVTGKYFTGEEDDEYATYSTDVPLGLVIKDGNYNNLPNKQLNFTIHGKSPLETSTLYVSRNSDIDDLSKEKIITVIYQYDYEESDASGQHLTPISERHVLNIHLVFKSGVPIVDDILPPDLVLPGTSITMQSPNVTPGAYPVQGGGWELFEKEGYAESHINGVEYVPSSTPLYWYQDGYYIAYYAKTYLGKTYSNHVPVSVANYHDLKKVMTDEHHLHVDYDRTRLKRDSKVYINDYTREDPTARNGLDLFKDFYDLSVGTTIEGQTPLNISEEYGTNIYDKQTYTKGVKAGKNLEFFLRTDIDHSKNMVPNPAYNAETNPNVPQTIEEDAHWTSIGTETQCFEGIFHGDGHTLSGLDNSLFKNLCGEVYNLGVTGSFKGAGVVDMGTGYVESAWVKTSATEALTTKPNAVFGSPNSSNTGYHLVNSYFWNGNKGLYANIEGDNPDVLDYNETITSGGAQGKATAKSDTAFYNGELAYDLNNFYLYKRYNDKITSTGEEARKYSYFTIDEDNKLTWQKDHYYGENPKFCSSGYIDNKGNGIKYVEDRFADGDFRFAAGTTTTENERYFVETIKDEKGEDEVVSTGWYPIWPDDYIFFGQKLTYGYGDQAHQDVPTAVVRDGNRLSQNDDANRVYRAPAYYRSKQMGVAHFNPTAYLAQQEKLTNAQIAANEQYVANHQEDKVVKARKAYPGMTAIDFAGHNNSNEVNGTYGLGLTAASEAIPQAFYPPLLDDDGLLSIQNCDETPNLLVYAPATERTTQNGYANKQTHEVLAGYFVDPVYNNYYDNSAGYRLVGENKDDVVGHLVQSDLTATNDHLLVDKEEFNAPIKYTFDSGHLMWYQRKPADQEFVDRSHGWQGISLPFTAELVTTHQKGEITHFYNGSYDYFSKDKNSGKEKGIKDGTKTKVGHEYWLREFTSAKDENNIAIADFTYPSGTGSETLSKKTVTNTFLWDYYYEGAHNQQDKNKDIYQEYYRNSRDYNGYALLTAAKPYIIGFPGKTYYEFDLSGKWNTDATTDVTRPEDVRTIVKQTITFASATGATIHVSDDELLASDNKPTHNGYTFMPSYLKTTLKAREEGSSSDTTPKSFTLNTTGDAYGAVTWKTEDDPKEQTVLPFRPYFIQTAANGARQTRSIVFSQLSPEDQWPKDPHSQQASGTLSAHSGRRIIAVTSTLSSTANVHILNTAGQTIATFDIQPGETIETRVNLSGIYVVQSTDGHYTKKMAVK